MIFCMEDLLMIMIKNKVFDIIRKILACYDKIKKEETIDCLFNSYTQYNDPNDIIKCIYKKAIGKKKWYY